MEQAQHALVAYGWDRLQSEVLAAALLNYGWRIVNPKTRTAELNQIDLVLIYCPEIVGISQAIQSARVAHPSTRIVLMGRCKTIDPDVLQFLEGEIDAYVGTHQAFPDLLTAMQTVLGNGSPSYGRMTQFVLENISRLTHHRSDRKNVDTLTLREKEVLLLITKGFSNKAIADHLSIAPNTVKNHVHNLLEKLEVRNRHEAAWMDIPL